MDKIYIPIEGAFSFVPTIFKDNRGQLIRIADDFDIAQINESHTYGVGTFRGIHYQPGMIKIVRCISGRVLDIVVDLRRYSSTYLQSYKMILYAEQQTMLCVPHGCGHGIMSLSDRSLVLYFLSTHWDPATEGGIRWDDPAIKLDLPFNPIRISDKDKSFPDWVI